MNAAAGGSRGDGSGSDAGNSAGDGVSDGAGRRASGGVDSGVTEETAKTVEGAGRGMTDGVSDHMRDRAGMKKSDNAGDNAGGGPGRSPGNGATSGVAADEGTVASGGAQMSQPVGCRAAVPDQALARAGPLAGADIVSSDFSGAPTAVRTGSMGMKETNRHGLSPALLLDPVQSGGSEEREAGAPS